VGIRVDWDNDEKTVIIVTLDTEWTWNDVQTINEKATILYESVDYVVDIIADVRDSRLVVTGILSYVRNLLTTPWHPHAGYVIVVGATISVRTLFEAAALAINKPLSRIAFAQTLEEARAIIQQRRAKR
jgi:hypothetical protein